MWSIKFDQVKVDTVLGSSAPPLTVKLMQAFISGSKDSSVIETQVGKGLFILGFLLGEICSFTFIWVFRYHLRCWLWLPNLVWCFVVCNYNIGTQVWPRKCGTYIRCFAQECWCWKLHLCFWGNLFVFGFQIHQDLNYNWCWVHTRWTKQIVLHDSVDKKVYTTGGQTQVPLFVTGVIKTDNAEIAVLDSDLGSIETQKKYVMPFLLFFVILYEIIMLISNSFAGFMPS